MNYYYGGAFDPMTKAHLQIIQNILKDMTNIDRLIIGITNHDYKRYHFSYELREEIVLQNLLRHTNIENNKRVDILEQNKRTWEFLNTNPNICSFTPLTIVLGEDEYNDLKSLKIWHFSKNLIEKYQFKVFSRSEETKDISSTKVRDLLNKDINDINLMNLITLETFNLIKNSGEYKK